MVNSRFKFRAWAKDVDYLMSWRELKNQQVDIGSIRGVTYLIFDDKNLILQQYTGLRDKNGVEIYEGDVVRHRRGGVYEVKHGIYIKSINAGEYDDECYGWYMDKSYFDDYDQLHNKDAIEVIGNIYENPELLEQ